MRFLATMMTLLVCSVSFGQSPTPELFIQPVNEVGQVSTDIYLGPGFDPRPNIGINPWPTPTGYPNYAPDCCERLARLEWMRNEYDILEEKIDDEYDILHLFLHEGQAPLTQGQAEIVLSTMLRISHFESALEEYGNLIIHQAQIYSVICVECGGCQP